MSRNLKKGVISFIIISVFCSFFFVSVAFAAEVFSDGANIVSEEVGDGFEGMGFTDDISSMNSDSIEESIFSVEDTLFTVKYHLDENSEASDMETEVEYGKATPTLTSVELGFEKEGMAMVGWKAYREYDQSWYFTDGINTVWSQEQPEGYNYYIYSDGTRTSQATPSGTVHFYAQWKKNEFIVKYHNHMESEASEQTTVIPRGIYTPTIKYSELGFSNGEKKFAGWAAQRESDGYWRMTDGVTTKWADVLEEGWEYVLYANGASIATTGGPEEIIHFYAQWNETASSFVVKYHLDENSEASDMETEVEYGTATPTLTSMELGFEKEGMVMVGWKAYREYDQSWYFTDGTDTIWSQEQPEGYAYYIYSDGTRTSQAAPAGTIVHFYAQWKKNEFTIKYHEDLEAEASSQVTTVERGQWIQTLNSKELGYEKDGMFLTGWIAYRESDQSWRATDGHTTEWVKDLNEGWEYIIYEKGCMVSNTGEPEDVVHFYGLWSSADIVVTDPVYGADGSDMDDDTIAIQKALNQAKDANVPIIIHVPAGRYYISKTLTIYSNTSLLLADEAEIIRKDDSLTMLKTGSSTGLWEGGYNQFVNVTISGGIWDGNVTNINENGYGENANNLMNFWHGDNITIKNMIIRHCCGNHFIEISAVKNSLIENVRFENFIPYAGTDYSVKDLIDVQDSSNTMNEASSVSEAIQIEYAYEANSGQSYPYDGTPCNNITIVKCTFNNCLAGIGNHHSEIQSSDYKFLDNNFINMGAVCFNIPNMTSVVISGNTATNIPQFIYAVLNSSVEARNNEMRFLESDVGNISSMIYASDSSLVFEANVISGAGQNGVRAVEGAKISAIRNSISNVGMSGLSATDAYLIATENIVTESAVYGLAIHGGKIEAVGNEFYNCGKLSICVTDNNDTACISEGIVTDNILDGAYYSVTDNILFENNILKNVITSLPQVKMVEAVGGNDGITVSWEAVKGATAYQIYRRENSGIWSSLTSNATGTSYIDKAAEKNVTYYYTARAINGNVKSKTWEEPGVHAVILNSLNNVELVSATSSDLGITVKWKAVNNAETYQIYRKAEGDKVWMSLTKEAVGTSYLDKTIEEQVKYYYTVRAVNGNIRSKGWEEPGVSTIWVTYLPIVKMINAEAGNNGITVKWAAVPGAATYQVYRRKKGETWSSLTSTVIGTNYVDKTAEKSVTYYYTVRAVSGNVKSASWEEPGVSAVIIDSLERVKMIDAEAGNNEITVKWEAVPGAVTYQVYRRKKGEIWSSLTSTVIGTSYVDKTVEKNIIYYYTVRAIRGSIKSTSWEEPGVNAAIVDSLERVKMVSAEVENNGITVKWEAVRGAVTYQIYRREKGGTWSSLNSTIIGTSYVDKTAEKNVTYYYTVRAINGSKKSATWEEPGVHAVILTFLNKVQLVGATASLDGIIVNWNAVENAERYQVYRRAEGEKAWISLTTVERGTNYLDSTVQEKVRYYYTVRAINGLMKSLEWEEPGVSALLITSLDEVEMIRAVTGKNGITINWKAVEYAETYQVYRKRADAKTWTALSITSETNYTDTNVESGVSYYYTVRAVNGNIKSSSWDDLGVGATSEE